MLGSGSRLCPYALNIIGVSHTYQMHTHVIIIWYDIKKTNSFGSGNDNNIRPTGIAGDQQSQYIIS